MYSQKLLDHFHHPRNVGEIPNATASVEVSNPACGDVMRLCAVVQDGVVQDIKFKVQGCVPSVACGSWLSENALGRDLASLAGLNAQEIETGLGGLPPASKHAAVLAADALARLLAQF